MIKQGGDKKVEVYYERIFKLTNYFQHQVDDNLLTDFFLKRFTTIFLDSRNGSEVGHLV
jgi:hypothetical protein